MWLWPTHWFVKCGSSPHNFHISGLEASKHPKQNGLNIPQCWELQTSYKQLDSAKDSVTKESIIKFSEVTYSQTNPIENWPSFWLFLIFTTGPWALQKVAAAYQNSLPQRRATGGFYGDGLSVCSWGWNLAPNSLTQMVKVVLHS
jgi:hypothetical protein